MPAFSRVFLLSLPSVSSVNPTCCWNKDQIAAEECPFLREGEQDLLFQRKKRFLRRCLECPRLIDDIRAMGTQLGGFGDILPWAIEEILSLRTQLQSVSGQFESRNREIKSLHEVSLALQTSVDMDEVIAMALTAITAGKGFGLNRAILLLVDKERQNLNGYFAVGPRSPEDAGRIWHEIEERDLSLPEMAKLFFEQKMAAEKERFQDLLGRLSVSLAENDHLFIRTLNDQRSRHVDDLFREPHIERWQAELLGVRELIMVPLISKNRRIGLLLADNIVNRRPIAAEDLQSLETFALPVSFAIERASLYERLQEKLSKLTEAHSQLREQQDLILRMEKMALVGKIASNIAHSIRNPLTIIGGFARTLAKSTSEDNPNRQYIESIVREAKHLEEVLQEVLNYSESLHPTLDLWDINQLAAGVYASLQEDLLAAGVECRLDLDPQLPLVKIDYKKISYCLRSIISNMLEALRNGGQMEIRTSRIGDELHLVLSDNGPGMAPELIRSVTAPFFSSKEQGSGLGLSLCARILETHGAGFDIHSEPGAGTSFTIRLNIAKEEMDGTHTGG